MILNQVWMRRDDPHVEPVTSAFGGWNHPAETINAIGSSSFNIQEIHRKRISNRGIVRLAHVGLNPNVGGFYRAEKNSSDNFQFVAHEHRRSTCLGCFHRI